jgi:hypothetical protein
MIDRSPALKSAARQRVGDRSVVGFAADVAVEGVGHAPLRRAPAHVGEIQFVEREFDQKLD